MSPDSLPRLRFGISGLAGSLGDFGTIIPLILAVALVSDVNIRYILVFFGIRFILTGLPDWYGSTLTGQISHSSSQ